MWVFVMLYLLRFHQINFQTDYILLQLLYRFFGISVILDVLNPPVINPLFFEDGSKLVGIVSWLAIFSFGRIIFKPRNFEKFSTQNVRLTSRKRPVETKQGVLSIIEFLDTSKCSVAKYL